MKLKFNSPWTMLWEAVIFIAILVGMTVNVYGEMIPIEYRKWDIGNNLTRHQIGGPPRNYVTSQKQWRQNEHNWITVDDTLYTNRRSLLKTDVNDSGQIFMSVGMGDDTATVAQRLLRLLWFNKADSTWHNIDNTPKWGKPTVLDNELKWRNVFPGVDVTVSKFDGQLDHALHFKPAFLDSAVILYNQRADSADIYLANVIAVQLTGVVDADSSLGTIKKRILRKFGKHILNFGGNYLEYPMSGNDPHIPIHQRHIIRNGKLYMLEFVKMSRLKWAHEKYPTATLWHRTSTNIETPDVEDCGLREDNGDRNNGGRTIHPFEGTPGSNSQSLLIRAFDLNNELGGSGYTATHCSLITQEIVHGTTGDVAVKRCWKHTWQEGTGTNTVFTRGVEVGATGNDFENSNSLVWGTEWGARCEQDGGSENANDDGACNTSNADRKATAEATINYSGTGRYATDITSLAQADANDSINVILTCDGTVNIQIATTENATAGNRLFFVFITSAAPAAAPTGRRRKILLGDNIGNEVKNEKDIMAAMRPVFVR